MPILPNSKPDSGFDDPLGLLSDCHRRIERFLAVLMTVADRTSGGPLDDQQRTALTTALRYFRDAAPRHTEDEEDSLFPRMRSVTGARAAVARNALRLVEELERQHGDAEAWHHEVDALGERWLNDNGLPERDFERLRDLLAMLRRLYQEHIAVEDNHVFPVAARLLTADQLIDMGREMAHRRGLQWNANGTHHDDGRRITA